MNKKPKTRSAKLTISFLAALVAIVGIGGLAIFRANSSSATETKTDTTQTKSLFSFTGATNWREGPSNETSMALFGKARDNSTSACFTSIQYKAGTVDIAAELQKQQDSLTTHGGTITQVATTVATLQTANGQKQYNYYQYALNGGGGENLMGGLGLGYLQLEDGYMQVDGHCETAEELASTVPALQAYKLHD